MPIFPIFRPRQKMPPAHTFVKPTVTGELTYTGASQQPTVSGFYSDFMSKSGETAKTTAGTYELVITLTDTDNCQWADGTTDPVTLEWTIEKANPETPTLSKASATLTELSATDTFTVTRQGNGEIHVESDNAKVTAEVASTTVTVTGTDFTEADTATITVTVGEGTNYNAYTATDVVFTVAITV